MLIQKKYNTTTVRTLDKMMMLALQILADQLTLEEGVQRMARLINRLNHYQNDPIFDVFRAYRYPQKIAAHYRIDVHVACLEMIIKYRIDPLQANRKMSSKFCHQRVKSD